MPRMTTVEYGAYLSRTRSGAIAASSDAVDGEGELHAAILDECKRRGWLTFYGSMAHKTFRVKGEPDFVILTEQPKPLLVECKAKTGKLSPDQAAISAWAAKLGHTVHVVRSLEEFIAIAK